MNKESGLKDKVILVVDDEQDIIDIVEEELDMCLVHGAKDYETAIEYLASYTYDAVVLDIMGVKGFDLLKITVSKGFPTIMLTAHAVTPDALKKSIKLGAVSFLPKEKLMDLEEFLENIILGEGKSIWKKVFEKFENYFNRRFGPDWKEKDKFFKEFELSLKDEES